MNLPVVADLSATSDSVGRSAPIGDRAPLIAEVRADVEAVPIVAVERCGGEGRASAVKIGGSGGDRAQCGDECGSADERLHCFFSLEWAAGGAGCLTGAPPAERHPRPVMTLPSPCRVHFRGL